MKKIKESKVREKKSLNVGLLVTFVFALIVVALGYVAMIKTEENVLRNYEKEDVCIVTKEIAANTELTETNIVEYVTTKTIDKSIVPEDAIKDVAALTGKSLRINVKPGTPLSDSMVYTVNEVYANMKAPKELSLSMSDLVQGVSGIVRTGDYIDIYILQKTPYSYSLSEAEMQQQINSSGEAILKHVYVSGAFNANGAIIPNFDRESSCQRINVVVEEEDTKLLYNKMLDGYVYIIKEVTTLDQ